MLDRFWRILDSETVRLYQVLMYTTFAVGGIYLTVAPGPESAVLSEMGTRVHEVWALLLIIAPIVVLIGTRLRNRWSGLILESAGDLCIFLLLATYVVAVIQTSWGRGVFSLPTHIGLTVSVLLLVVRDVRRLIQIEHLAKELRR